MKEIYLPELKNQSVATLGERHFFKSKVWKVLVIFGTSWRDTDWTLRGFTIWNVNGQKYFDRVCNELDKRGITYKVSQSTWQTRINISTRKANLEKIDAWYKEYYNETKKSFKENGIVYVHDNFYLDEERYQKSKELAGKWHRPEEYIKIEY